MHRAAQKSNLWPLFNLVPQVYALMEKGAASRATGATKLNEISSRSHAIFMLIVEKSTLVGGMVAAAQEALQGMLPGDQRHWQGVEWGCLR